MEKLSRIHAEHQETSSAPHEASVTCDHRGEGEADDTGEHTWGGQLVTAQMLADVTQGHAELQAAAARERREMEGRAERELALHLICANPLCAAALEKFLAQQAASSGF